MFDKYPAPQTEHDVPHHYGGPYVAGLETVPTSPAEHTVNELVLTICDLAFGSHGSWSGTASEILQAAHAGNRLAGVTPEQVDRNIEAIAYLLFEFDGIQHFVLKNCSKHEMKHVFLVRE